MRATRFNESPFGDGQKNPHFFLALGLPTAILINVATAGRWHRAVRFNSDPDQMKLVSGLDADPFATAKWNTAVLKVPD